MKKRTLKKLNKIDDRLFLLYLIEKRIIINSYWAHQKDLSIYHNTVSIKDILFYLEYDDYEEIKKHPITKEGINKFKSFVIKKLLFASIKNKSLKSFIYDGKVFENDREKLEFLNKKMLKESLKKDEILTKKFNKARKKHQKTAF